MSRGMLVVNSELMRMKAFESVAQVVQWVEVEAAERAGVVQLTQHGDDGLTGADEDDGGVGGGTCLEGGAPPGLGGNAGPVDPVL